MTSRETIWTMTNKEHESYYIQNKTRPEGGLVIFSFSLQESGSNIYHQALIAHQSFLLPKCSAFFRSPSYILNDIIYR